MLTGVLRRLSEDLHEAYRLQIRAVVPSGRPTFVAKFPSQSQLIHESKISNPRFSDLPAGQYATWLFIFS